MHDSASIQDGDGKVKITVITPARNEERVITNAIRSVRALIIPNKVEFKHVVVADRSSDRTVEICRNSDVKVIEKNWRGNFQNPTAEAIDYGIKNTESDLIGVVDADILLSRDWLIKLLPHLDNETVSVASDVKTRTGKWWLDILMWLRDLNFKIAPLGKQPRGAARLINRKLLEQIGGLTPNAPSFDTALDLRIREHQYKTKLVEDVIVLEKRPLTIRRIVKRQLSDGKARRKMHLSFTRTILHSIFRFRPFVLIGYFTEMLGE